jgi:putative Holliday junction resolvase
MRIGVRLGVDVGTVRIGVAASDAAGVLATPVDVLRRDKGHNRDLARLAELARDRGAVEILVGLPRPLRGGENMATRTARDYAAELSRHVAPLPVRLVDERFSTVEATRALRASGKSGRKARAVVDAAAAVVLLQAALDTERNTGSPVGEPVEQ